jgi:hypothetical protein
MIGIGLGILALVVALVAINKTLTRIADRLDKLHPPT